MKLLFLTKYTALGASSRMRTFQYLRHYEAAGIDCTVSSFFNDAYLHNLYGGKPSRWSLFNFYMKRFLVFFTVFKYDKVYIEKEIFPYSPPFAEWLLFLSGKDYLVDYDDAIFHNYDRNSNFFIRTFLENKIDIVMKHAEVVIAGNSYLAKRAEKAGAKKVIIVPTVVDLERYVPSAESTKGRKFIIGWIGTKTTFEKHLLSIKDWLLKAQDLFDLEIHIIGITENDVFLGDHVKYVPWTAETEVEAICKIDVGIMPLRHSPWEEGKCAYKIIQYMACGKPVIASNVGVNAEMCLNGDTGFLADTEEEFLEALHFLINNKMSGENMGKKGRALVEKSFNIEKTSKKMAELILGK
ncbi:glycosyltransferase family 4 protein [Kaistella sp. 97-N-M2]|uniref:glycosyltransferase family 4 protein n=1 Tax=Kaistella sp. 97-N-M2 TaxID=2908645 RepID=UPI001F2208FD|nr:glycosyltransferase family 4 protein [Kaistella sp. 97-N-M2]UJF28779.1 glycosyltransferase family 4 protein [Kaistella sp. 97-N-M2]